MKKGIVVFLLVLLTAGFSWAAGGTETEESSVPFGRRIHQRLGAIH